MKYPDQESHILEFKAEIPKSGQILKTIIGFCNQAGGRLILGVEDSGKVIGIPEAEAMELMEWAEKAVYEASSPPIIPKVMTQRVGGKLVLVIKVGSGMRKPYYRKSEGLERGTYVRIGRSTVRATADMIEELRWQGRGLSYDAMPVHHAAMSDLDEKKIQRFFERRKSGAEVILSEEVLKNYHFLQEEHAHTYPSVAGILLFGNNVQKLFPEGMIICSHFRGISGREAIASRDCVGTLFEQFNHAYEFILSRLNKAFTIRGAYRQETLEVPEEAIREILLNAIIHRNYHLRAPSKVAIYENRIEIFSPGSFPTPFPNLRMGLTDVRNMAICRAFREIGLIEKLGSGLLTVFDSYSRRGLPEPEIINGDGFVKCKLPRANGGDQSASGELLRIMQLFQSAEELSISDVMETLNLPRATASRRLKELIEQGKLERLGKGPATRYRLKS